MSDTIKSRRLEGTQLIVETSTGTQTYDSKFLVAAMLIFIARGSGRIEPEESSKMIDLIEQHFQMEGAESLELLTRAISEMAENPELPQALTDLAPTLSESDKEDIALMGLKVIASDGERDVTEMEQFSNAMQAMEIEPEIVHRAFDRYFDQTMPGK